MPDDQTLAALRRLRGSTLEIARRCGVTPSAVSQWTSIPAQHLATVDKLATEWGIPNAPRDHVELDR